MENTVEPILRFAHYALLLGMFGWSAFRLLGLKSLDWRKTDARRVSPYWRRLPHCRYQ